MSLKKNKKNTLKIENKNKWENLPCFLKDKSNIKNYVSNKNKISISKNVKENTKKLMVDLPFSTFEKLKITFGDNILDKNKNKFINLKKNRSPQQLFLSKNENLLKKSLNSQMGKYLTCKNQLSHKNNIFFPTTPLKKISDYQNNILKSKDQYLFSKGTNTLCKKTNKKSFSLKATQHKKLTEKIFLKNKEIPFELKKMKKISNKNLLLSLKLKNEKVQIKKKKLQFPFKSNKENIKNSTYSKKSTSSKTTQRNLYEQNSNKFSKGSTKRLLEHLI